jgi:uncharacterized protein (TIGR02996 family)
MRDDSAFLHTIRESPEDDGPRLVYADWLEEQGDGERAEFIRAQVELARRPAGGFADGDPRRHALAEREAELLDACGDGWLGRLPRLAGIEWGEFRRGFVEAVAAESVAALRRNAEVLFTATPVRSLRFYQLRAAKSLADLPALARVTELVLDDSGIGDDGVEALARSKYAGNLRRLMLGENDLGPASAAAIARSPFLTQLTELHLGENAVGDAGAAALAESPNLRGLVVLDLFENGVTDAGARALAASPHLSRLTLLDLGGHRNPIGDAGALALALSPNLPRLTQLTLEVERVGDVAVRALRRRWPGVDVVY